MRIAVAGLVLVWLAALSCLRHPATAAAQRADAARRGGDTAGRATSPGAAWPALAGAAALAGLYLLVHLVAPAAMGAGDVKLAIGLGGLAGCFGAGCGFWRRWPRRC